MAYKLYRRRKKLADAVAEDSSAVKRGSVEKAAGTIAPVGGNASQRAYGPGSLYESGNGGSTVSAPHSADSAQGAQGGIEQQEGQKGGAGPLQQAVVLTSARGVEGGVGEHVDKAVELAAVDERTEGRAAQDDGRQVDDEGARAEGLAHDEQRGHVAGRAGHEQNEGGSRREPFEHQGKGNGDGTRGT